jgi:hypothetical protein
LPADTISFGADRERGLTGAVCREQVCEDEAVALDDFAAVDGYWAVKLGPSNCPQIRADDQMLLVGVWGLALSRDRQSA